ncbi:hypothetical protein EAE96_006251 [Botrytis aclada]|nr:hypothetical protein EAE96_006251 [Botrytis aclada]
MVLVTEPAIPEVGEKQSHSHFGYTYPEMRAPSEMGYVVMLKGHGNAICCPIYTYSGQATLKPNLPAPHSHAIIYTSPVCPNEHYYVTNDGCLKYENLVMSPIRVDSEQDDISGQLHPSSRLNYGRVYTVEHYARVFIIGMVTSESMDTFKENLTRTVSSAQRPRSDVPPKKISGHSSHQRNREPKPHELHQSKE